MLIHFNKNCAQVPIKQMYMLNIIQLSNSMPKNPLAHKGSISSTLIVRIFRTNIHFGSFYYVHVTRKKLPKWRSYEKCVRFTLMKLTQAICRMLVKWTQDNWSFQLHFFSSLPFSLTKASNISYFKSSFNWISSHFLFLFHLFYTWAML